MGKPSDLVQGTLDLLILKTIALEPMHGWGITQGIASSSRGVLEVNQGSLYLALQRLEQRRAITAEWQTTDNNRRAKYYRLTPKGRLELADETEAWRRYALAVAWVLRTT